MKKQLFVIFLFSISFYSQAQITFQRTYGGPLEDGLYGFSSVKQTTDGGYIIAGKSSSFGVDNLGDAYLIKTDAYGDTLWTKTFGRSYTDYGKSVQQTADGGYIILGNNSPLGYEMIYLIKTDANGDSLWTRNLGNTISNWGNYVQQTTDGGYIITGANAIVSLGNEDVYLVKTDAFGNPLWAKTFGGQGEDVGQSVQQTTDGGYIITGYTGGFGTGKDVYLVKTDANGDTLWTKTFGGLSVDEGYSVQQTTDGGYIITGDTWSFGAGNYDVYIIKTDSAGNLLWSKTFGGANADNSYSVKQTTDGGYIIAGVFRNPAFTDADVYLIKTDANGDSLWTRTFGDTVGWGEAGVSVQQTADGGYIIGANARSFGAGLADIYLIKTDSIGNSGCYEKNPNATVTTPATQTTYSVTTVTSPAINVMSTVTFVGNGAIVADPCTAVGIQSVIPKPGSEISISPNPSSGNFIISFEARIMKGNIEIVNMLRENVLAENIFNESKKEINLKNITGGIYFVKVFDGEKSNCRKLIIE